MVTGDPNVVHAAGAWAPISACVHVAKALQSGRKLRVSCSVDAFLPKALIVSNYPTGPIYPDLFILAVLSSWERQRAEFVKLQTFRDDVKSGFSIGDLFVANLVVGDSS